MMGAFVVIILSHSMINCHTVMEDCAQSICPFSVIRTVLSECDGAA